MKETNGKSQKWKIAIKIIMTFFGMEFQNLFNNSIKVLKSLLKRESWTPYCFIVLFVFFSSGVFFSATLISLGTNQLGCTGLGTKDRSDKWCSIILKCWEYHLVVLYIFYVNLRWKHPADRLHQQRLLAPGENYLRRENENQGNLGLLWKSDQKMN